MLATQIFEQGLPKKYQEVSYLENSGTQYIVTHFLPTENTGFDIEFAFTNNQRPDQALFGSNFSWQYGCFGAHNYNNRWYIISALHGWRNAGMGTQNTNIEGRLWTDGAILRRSDNGILRQSITANTTYASMPTPLYTYIFATNDNNRARDLCKCARIYSLKFFEGTANTAYFVPCYRKSDNKPGMFDLVSRMFYTNAGTGEFLVGSDVN